MFSGKYTNFCTENIIICLICFRQVYADSLILTLPTNLRFGNLELNRTDKTDDASKLFRNLFEFALCVHDFVGEKLGRVLNDSSTKINILFDELLSCNKTGSIEAQNK